MNTNEFDSSTVSYEAPAPLSSPATDVPDTLTVGEIRQLPPRTITWIVDDVIEAGTARPHLLAGYPESGKSTLARQLAVCVANGIPFLSHAVRQGRVIYAGVENTHLQNLKAIDATNRHKPENDELLIFRQLDGAASRERIIFDLQTLLLEYRAHGGVSLVIIETLDVCLKRADASSSNQTNEAFASFKNELTLRFPETAFVLLHHLNKKSEERGANIYTLRDSSEIAGNTDTKIYLQTDFDQDERRVIEITHRNGGEKTKPTYLEHYPAQNWSEFGLTVKQFKAEQIRQQKTDAGRAKEQAIITAVMEHPGQSMSWYAENALSGRKQFSLQRIKTLIAAGTLVECGNRKILYVKGYAPQPEPSEPKEGV